ncbi:MAG: SLBB domain-containing protein [Acidobacteria bacterium]|nr:SLBB domain-containing protein [Acidobacteriota bacterium]
MKPSVLTVAAFALTLCSSVPLFAQTPPPNLPSAQQAANYVVGPQDVLVITSYDQPELTGKFTVEIDGTFTYPLIGRLRVGGMTLRGVEAALRKELVDQGFFRDPQVTVAVEQYRSQKIYIVGEVRTPGAYPMSGDMRLVEALALAGSTLATASGEAVIVRPSSEALVIEPTARKPAVSAELSPEDPDKVVRVDLRELENGDLTQNVALRNGDTIFVLRAESVYVFGQVRNPGAYPLRQKDTTVLQALALAGGITDRGSTGRIQIVRIVDGKREELRAELTDFVLPRDTIIVPERFF